MSGPPPVALGRGSRALRSRRVRGAGGQVAVVEVGPPDVPAVVVAHGAGSSARFVRATLATAVVASGRRLVTYDLRGHGASDPARDVADHHLDVHADDLAAVASSVDGVVEVVGGISLGAHAAVRAAASGLLVPCGVLLACLPAWTGASARGVGPHAAVAAEVRAHGTVAVVDRLRRDDAMPAWLRRTVVTDFSRHDPRSLTAALLALDGAPAPDEEELSSLRQPLAVVAWPDDPAHPIDVARRWARAAPGGVLGQLHLADLDADLGTLGEVVVATLDRALHRPAVDGRESGGR